jgi:ABC-2 type transport system permease protein
VRATSLIFRRELGAYLRAPLGYVIASAVLFVTGLLFYGRALGAGKRLSADVLREFFYVSSGLTMIAAIALSIRLLAEERERGTIVLLNTSPVRDVEIVLGKFLSAFVFLSGILTLTVYMPALIMVRGKISMGQVLVGYSGLFLLGAATLAIGVFASAIARHQIVAAVVGAATTATLLLVWYLAEKLGPPLNDVFAGMALHARHFQPFTLGTLHLRDVVYYLSVTYIFLLLATKIMEARRWQ